MAGKNGIRILTARPDAFDMTMKFLLENFRLEEPISRAVGLTKADSKTLFAPIIDCCLKSDTSQLIYNKRDELVAVRLTSQHKRGKPKQLLEGLPLLTPTAQKIANFIDLAESGLWDLVPAKVDHLLKFEVISVRSDYFRQGIATRSIDRAFERAHELAIQGFFTCATAYKTQQMYNRKLGFRILKETRHSDYKDEHNHQIITCDDGTNKAWLLYRDANIISAK